MRFSAYCYILFMKKLIWQDFFIFGFAANSVNYIVLYLSFIGLIKLLKFKLILQILATGSVLFISIFILSYNVCSFENITELFFYTLSNYTFVFFLLSYHFLSKKVYLFQKNFSKLD
jgi:hypothetical protein